MSLGRARARASAPLSFRVVIHAALMLLQTSRKYDQRRRMNGQARRMNTDAADQHQPEDAANKLTDAWQMCTPTRGRKTIHGYLPRYKRPAISTFVSSPSLGGIPSLRSSGRSSDSLSVCVTRKYSLTTLHSATVTNIPHVRQR